MSIESEIIVLVKALPAFYTPVTTGFTPNLTLSDAEVLDRLAFSQVKQSVAKVFKTNVRIPYLYWEGPFRTDLGQAAIGFSGTSKANFWFNCCHRTMTEAAGWADAIQAAVAAYFLTNQYMNLVHYRLMNAVFLDRICSPEDLTIRLGEEYPVSRCQIGFTFGYQSSGN